MRFLTEQICLLLCSDLMLSDVFLQTLGKTISVYVIMYSYFEKQTVKTATYIYFLMFLFLIHSLYIPNMNTVLFNLWIIVAPSNFFFFFFFLLTFSFPKIWLFQNRLHQVQTEPSCSHMTPASYEPSCFLLISKMFSVRRSRANHERPAQFESFEFILLYISFHLQYFGQV